MHGLGYAAAAVLAVVFGAAAVAKLGSGAATRRSFSALGLPPSLATVVPVVELAIAVGLLVAPGWAAAVALALLAAFTTFLARAVRDGVTAPCQCFGSARNAPVSNVELWRNGALGLAALVALTADRPTLPHAGGLLVVAVAAAAVVLGLRRLDQEGPRLGRPLPLPVDGPAIVAFVSPGCPRCELDRPALEVRGATILELSPTTAAAFRACRVRATPYYVAVDADGVVRSRGPELSDLQSAT